MELVLIRSVKTNKSTIGELAINGQSGCFVLEDKDRGLRQGMAISELMALKIKTKTAIPAGRYEIVVSFSDGFRKMLPLLLNVPGYESIRIHPGNTAENTDRCLLPGKTRTADFAGSSKTAFTSLF